MVIHNIHHDADACLMQRLHHLLCLFDAHLAVIGLGGIGALRHIVVHRIVAPVEFRFGLIHRAEVIHRQDMQVRNAKFLQVIDTRRHTSGCLCSLFRKFQILSGILHAGAFIHRKIPDVQLIDYRIRDPLPGMGITVVLPALRVCAVEVNDHRAVAVHSGRSRIGIARLRALAVSHRLIGIIGAVQIAFRLQKPCSVHVSRHGKPLRPVVRRSVTALIQVHINLIGKRRPHLENSLLRRPYSAEVIASVGICLLKFLCGIDIRHSHLILHAVKGDAVILINIQPGLRRQDIDVILSALYLADCDVPILAEHFVCLLGIFNRSRHFDADYGIFIVIGRLFQLDSNDDIIPVLLGIALHAGLNIDVHRSRNHL